MIYGMHLRNITENYPDKLRVSSKMFAEKMKQTFSDDVKFKARMTIQEEEGKVLGMYLLGK